MVCSFFVLVSFNSSILCILDVYYFKFICSIPLYDFFYFGFCVIKMHSPIHGYLNYFQVSVIASKTALNIFFQAYLVVCWQFPFVFDK